MLFVDGARDRELGPILDLIESGEEADVVFFFIAPLAAQLEPAGALQITIFPLHSFKVVSRARIGLVTGVNRVHVVLVGHVVVDGLLQRRIL